MKYNERKINVLEAIANLGETRARKLMNYLGNVSLEATKKALTRYKRQGLLTRTRGLYRLSGRGYEWLEYLQSIMKE